MFLSREMERGREKSVRRRHGTTSGRVEDQSCLEKGESSTLCTRNERGKDARDEGQAEEKKERERGKESEGGGEYSERGGGD